MIQQLLLALLLASLTVVLHGVGTVYGVLPAAGMGRPSADNSVLLRPVWSLTRLVSFLLLLHLVEMSVWAAAYSVASVFPDFETSLYFSLTSFTTIGYGDVLPVRSWRL